MDWIPSIGEASYQLKLIWSKLWIEEDDGRAETLGINWVDWIHCYNWFDFGYFFAEEKEKKEKEKGKRKEEKEKEKRKSKKANI